MDEHEHGKREDGILVKVEITTDVASKVTMRHKKKIN